MKPHHYYLFNSAHQILHINTPDSQNIINPIVKMRQLRISYRNEPKAALLVKD